MKTIITALTGLLLSTAGANNAQAEVKANRYVLATKALAQSYNNVVILGDVDVVLVEGTSNNLTMEGYQSQLDQVSLEVNGNTLVVDTKKKVKGQRPLVYIPVSKLQHLTVKGRSIVTTLGYLQGSDVEVNIASDCQVQIKTTGTVSVNEIDGYTFEVEKWNTARI